MWHRKSWAGPAIRLGGAIVLAAAFAAGNLLLALAAAPSAAEGLAGLALAALTFACGSAGSAMVVLGAHLFDEVRVSGRWQRRPSAPPRDIDAETS